MVFQDRYAAYYVNYGAYTDAAAVTPHDDNDLAETTNAVWVGSTGNMAVNMADGTSVTFNSIPAGTLLPIRVTRIKATNTTASDIVALY